ncbi:MAG: hypothetical protein SOZ01_09145 [Selenomonadaceae bacterium]|nr:hypothetical protein [Selenomonadaceae bacterium]
MSISKATFLSSLARFRANMLKEVTDGWVEDPKDGSTLFTPADQTKLNASSTDETITDADIDSIFSSSDSSSTAETSSDSSTTN